MSKYNRMPEIKVFKVLFKWFDNKRLNLLIDVGSGRAVHVDNLPLEAGDIFYEDYKITASDIGLIPLFVLKRLEKYDSEDEICYELENYKTVSDKPIVLGICKDGLVEYIGKVPETFYIYPSR